MDALCMGFVQVSSKIPLGMKISHISTYLGKQYDLKLTVFKVGVKQLSCFIVILVIIFYFFNT